MHPDYGVAHFSLGLAYEAQGKYERADNEYRRSIALLGDVPELLASRGRLCALTGRTEDALSAIQMLVGISGSRYVSPYFIALVYTALGERDNAFESLERGFAVHDEDLALLKVDPRLDTLRCDARFGSLLDRVGLANTTNRQTL
jgi:tetratricopeptide (TPR) repeat protein